MAEFIQEVKEAAYKLDPECWVSYSGKPKVFKRAMEVRRVDSLTKAQNEYDIIHEYDEIVAAEGGW